MKTRSRTLLAALTAAAFVPALAACGGDSVEASSSPSSTESRATQESSTPTPTPTRTERAKVSEKPEETLKPRYEAQEEFRSKADIWKEDLEKHRELTYEELEKEFKAVIPTAECERAYYKGTRRHVGTCIDDDYYGAIILMVDERSMGEFFWREREDHESSIEFGMCDPKLLGANWTVKPVGEEDWGDPVRESLRLLQPYLGGELVDYGTCS